MILRQWKRRHEEFLADRGMVPDPPLIVVQTLNGLLGPVGVGDVVSADDLLQFRDQILTVANDSDVCFRNIRVRIQFPEAVNLAACKVRHPGGTRIDIVPVTGTFAVQGAGSFIKTAPTPQWHDSLGVSISELLPRNTAQVAMRSRVVNLSAEQLRDNNDGTWCCFFVHVAAQYQWHNKYCDIEAHYPLWYDPEARTIRLGTDAENGLTDRFRTTVFIPIGGELSIGGGGTATLIGYPNL